MLLNVELVAAPQNCQQYYNDVPADHFAYTAACLFWQRGWSTSLSQLGVDEKTKRADTAQLLHQIFASQFLQNWHMTLGDILENGQVFRDVPTDHYAFYESAVLKRAGIVAGYPDGRFGPEATLNRAEAAAVVDRAMQKAEAMGIRLE